MADNNRVKRKLNNLNAEEANENKKIRWKGRSNKSDTVPTEQRKVNKASTPKTSCSKQRKISQTDNDESRTHSENNNNAIVPRKKITEAPIPHCSKQNDPKEKLTPAKSRHLGDDIAVLIGVDNSNEFEISDEEMAQIETRPQTSNDETAEELDYDDDVQNTESDSSDDQGELLSNQFDETALSVAENEVFFNFKRPLNFRIVDDKSDTMEEVIERLVNKQLQSEKEKLREEYQLLEQMWNEYKALMKEKKNVDSSKNYKGNRITNKSPRTGTPKQKNDKETRVINAIKSPSDTTIYAPVLAKSPAKEVNHGMRNSVGNQYIDNISNFVEQMRLHQELKDRQQEGEVLDQMNIGDPSQQEEIDNETEKRDERRSEARSTTDRIIREVELFWANIEHPKGNAKNNLDFRQLDDEFFHLTCHIDSTLMEKIKKGQFVDLEKLLPSDRFKK